MSGLPWIEGEQQALPPQALAAKMLCERHNAALSSLDSIAVRLFRAFDEKGASGSGRQELFLFNGHDVERWLLKVLCGIIESRSIVLGRSTDSSIPHYWLDILFGQAEFPRGQGLYVCKSVGHSFDGPRGIALQIIAGASRVTGIGVWVCGYEFVLSMSGFSSRQFDGRGFAYRPLEFYVEGPEYEKSVLFCWDGDGDLGTISLKIE